MVALRPALVTLVSLMLGIYIGSLALLAAQWYLVGIALATLLLLITRICQRSLGGIIWCVVICCAGACLSTIPQERVIQLPTPSATEIYRVTLSRAPMARERGYRVEAIIQPLSDTTWSSRSISSYWEGRRVMLYLDGDRMALTPRTSYIVYGQLKPIYQIAHKSYQHYLHSRHVCGVLTVYSARPSPEVVGLTHWTIWDQLYYHAYMLQQHMGSSLDRIDALTPSQRETLRAICLGDRSGGVDVVVQFRNVGVSHLLSVSGFHVGVVLLLVYWLLRYPLLLIRHTDMAHQLRWFLTLVAIWVYALVCGLTIPTSRATLMFSLFAIGRLLGLATDRLNVWAQAAIILLVISPYALFDVGMQLSFVAVLAILVTWGNLNRRITPSGSPLIRYISYTLITTVAVQLFVWPILAHHFGSSSVWLLLTNIFLSPLASLLIIVGLVTMTLLSLGLSISLLNMLLVSISDLSSWTVAMLGEHFATQIEIFMPLWLCIIYYLLLYCWVQYLDL